MKEVTFTFCSLCLFVAFVSSCHILFGPVHCNSDENCPDSLPHCIMDAESKGVCSALPPEEESVEDGGFNLSNPQTQTDASVPTPPLTDGGLSGDPTSNPLENDGGTTDDPAENNALNDSGPSTDGGLSVLSQDGGSGG